MADQDASPLPDSFAIWDKYEQVAMHFNDLIMRWRLQAIGGLAGVVAVAGFVVKDSDPDYQYRAMLLLSLALTVGWVGIAIIDLFYYRRLLQGAVKAILALEESTPRIQLSTLIEKNAKSGAAVTPWLFYSCGLLPLLGFAVWASVNMRADASIPPGATASVAMSSPPDDALGQLRLSQACAESANQFWKRFGYDSSPTTGETTSYANHYNRSLDKCLIIVRRTTLLSSGKWTLQEEVVDALEVGDPLGTLLTDSSGNAIAINRSNRRVASSPEHVAWFRDLMAR